MIKNITAQQGLTIAGVSSSNNYVPQTGMVRWNGSTQQFDVMDQQNWIPLYQTDVSIGPDYGLTNIMNWARIKMAEEDQLKVLMDKHPGLKDVKEKFDIMLALVRNNEFSEDK